MRDATAGPNAVAFATYLDRHERADLDARAATAEQERDDLADDLQDVRQQLATVTRERDALWATSKRYAEQGAQYLRERDEALEARDVLRHREQLLLDVMRRVVEDLDRALAHYETQPEQSQESRLGSPADRAQDEPASKMLPAGQRCRCGCRSEWHLATGRCCGDFLACACREFVPAETAQP